VAFPETGFGSSFFWFCVGAAGRARSMLARETLQATSLLAEQLRG
jgi:hypothetical protein